MNIMGHASIGGIFGLVLFFFLIKKDRYISGLGYKRFFAATTIFMLLFSALALLPDIGHIWGDVNTDASEWSDVFFFARFIDRFASSLSQNTDTSIEFLLIVVVTLLFSFVLTYGFNNDIDFEKFAKKNSPGKFIDSSNLGSRYSHVYKFLCIEKIRQNSRGGNKLRANFG